MQRFRTPAGGIGHISEDVLVYLSGDELTAVETHTGTPLWRRSGLKTPADVLGNGQEVMVIADNDPQTGNVYRVLDGAFVARRELPQLENPALTSGALVVNRILRGNQTTLHATDRVTGRTLWTRTLDGEKPADWLVAPVAQDEIALWNPKQRLQILDLKTGAVRLDSPLTLEAPLEEFHVLRDRDRYLVATWIPPQPQPGAADPNQIVRTYQVNLNFTSTAYPKANGPLFAFDRRTGNQLWKTDIDDQYFYPQLSPAGSPLLVFGRRTTITTLSPDRRRRQQKSTDELVVLDKRNGNRLHRSDVASRLDNLHVRAEPQRQMVFVESRGRRLAFQLTDKPVAPNTGQQPPDGMPK